jgi:quinoprotein dehydrogenase-associated probable ABC transporter substrate-binding protein
MATGFVRRTLAANRCDVIIGYAQGDELVLNTNHYYTSTHVLLTGADGDLADVTSLADPRLRGREIGVIAGSPPASYLARYGLMGGVHGYQLMVDRRVDSPNERMLADLMAGEIDAALMWGPIGGPLAKAQGDAVAMAPLLESPPPGGPQLFYRITMGVRAGEDRWKRELNSKIRELQPQIDAILAEYGVPVVNDMGTALKAAAQP